MSSEIVKKRGRPKKVVSNPVEPELAEITKKPSTTRTKSTKASTSKPKAKSATSAKSSTATTAAAKLEADTTASGPQKVGLKSSASAVKKAESNPPQPPLAAKKPEQKSPPPTPAVHKTESRVPQPAFINAAGNKTPITPATSKILSKVRELSQNQNPPPTQTPTSSSKTPATAPSAKSPVTRSIPSHKASPAQKSTSSTSAPHTKPNPPIAGLNSAIVSNITSRAGAKPISNGNNALPPNYKSVARKITLAIVAMPIALVTSWVLYERLVLGEEPKLLSRPGLILAGTEKEGDVVIPSKPTPE